jgi:hypothetical protein
MGLEGRNMGCGNEGVSNCQRLWQLNREMNGWRREEEVKVEVKDRSRCLRITSYGRSHLLTRGSRL